MLTGFLGLAVLALDGYAVYDVYKGSMSTGKKALWIVGILAVPVVGVGLYFLIARKKG